MLEETHRRIAREIAKDLNLNEREASLLEVGSAGPDSWANFPHHEGKEYEIAKNILGARKLYIQNDDECFAHMGNALHYIEDRWTMRPRLSDKHTKWEESINQAPILDDSQLENVIRGALLPTKAEKAYLSFLEDLKKGLVSILDEALKQKWESLGFYCEGNIPYLPFAGIYLKPFGAKVVYYALQSHPTTWSTAVLDLNFAYRICLEVARNVFSKEDNKEDWTLPAPAPPSPICWETHSSDTSSFPAGLQASAPPSPIGWETPYRPFGIMLFIFSFVLFIIAFANVVRNPGLFLLSFLLGGIFMMLGIVLYFEKREKRT